MSMGKSVRQLLLLSLMGLILAACATPVTTTTGKPTTPTRQAEETTQQPTGDERLTDLLSTLQTSWDTDNANNRKAVCGMWTENQEETVKELLADIDPTPLNVTQVELEVAVKKFFDTNCLDS